MDKYNIVGWLMCFDRIEESDALPIILFMEMPPDPGYRLAFDSVLFHLGMTD